MILVTGASGFLGGALVERLMANNAYCVVAAVRRPDIRFLKGVKLLQVGDLLAITRWNAALRGVNTVVHCAARVHVRNDNSPDLIAEFFRVNVEGTVALARQAAAAGVRRFVFLSSIKVNGEFTELGRLFTADDLPAPMDPYAISKYEAEQSLRKIAFETGMEVVILRPPLVYGPSVKANFESMMRWLGRGVPLPLAAVTENRRSFVALDNLVDLIVTCLDHPAAANQTFLASDGEDLSTADLLTRMGSAMGRPARLFYLPPSLLKLGAAVLNKPEIYQRLCGSLQADISKTKHLLGWSPPVSLDEGLRRTIEDFKT